MFHQMNRWLLTLGVIIIAIVSVIGVAQAETPIGFGETISAVSYTHLTLPTTPYV